jgi:N-terminal half of MaoC dehydratase
LLGRWVSDLEVGDVLGPVDHIVTPFLIREYAHAVEDASDRHQGPDHMVAPPTIVHAHKIRLLDAAYPEGAGPAARVHLIYDATHHRSIPAGQEVSIVAAVTDRYEQRGRDHLVIDFEVRDKATGEVYTTYRDTSLLSYRPRG